MVRSLERDGEARGRGDAGYAGSGRRGAEMSRFSAKPGEDGRPEDAVVRGSPFATPPPPASPRRGPALT